MRSDSDSDAEEWEELSKEIDDFVFGSDAEDFPYDSPAEESEPEPEETPMDAPIETPVYGATLRELDSLWGEGRWRVTAMHLADYIAQKDYLPIQYCCGQISD